MAELLGPDAASRTVDLGGGKSAHGRTATVYSNSAGTTLAAILTWDGTETPGAAISGSQVTVGAGSQLPLFWFPDTYDTLYVRVTGMSGVKTIYADMDRRLDAQPMAQGAAVADQGALTASAAGALTAATPAALTAVAAAGATPTDDEFDALLADVTEVRTQVAAAVVDLAAIRTATNAAITDLGTARTKVNALLASLRAAGLIDT